MNEAFPFDSFPVSVEAIQEYTRRFFSQEKVRGNFVTKIWLNTLIGIIRCLPFGAAYHLGTFVGKVLYLIKIRSHVALTNLNIVYGDTKSSSEKMAIYRDSLINFGHVIINYMRLPFQGETFWRQHCELVNEDVLKKAMNRKKGVLFIGGHIGMWDLAGGKVGMSGYPMSVIARKIGNPVINKFVNDARVSMNMGAISNKNTMKQILLGLKRGEAIVVAIDQNMGKDRGAFLDWMGTKASCVKSTAYIVKESGAAVIPGFMVQLGPKEFKFILGDELSWIDCPEDPEKEMMMNLQNQANAVQKIILHYPEIWFWIHKRWKNRPQGDMDPYKKK